MTAVGSRTQESADAFAAEHGIPTRTRQLRGARRRPRGRRRSTSRPRTRSTPRTRCSRSSAGKHVLVEKPFTLNEAEARQVVDLAAAKGLVVLEAMWTRWLPHMVRIRELLAVRRARRGAHAHRRPRPEAADRSRAPHAEPAARRRRAARPRHLPGLVRLGRVRRPGERARDLLADRRPASTGRPRSSSATRAASRRSCTPSSTPAAHRPRRSSAPRRRIEIDRVWYTPTSFSLIDPSDTVIETLRARGAGPRHAVPGRRARSGSSPTGRSAGDVLPPGGDRGDHGHPRRDPSADRAAVPRRMRRPRSRPLGPGARRYHDPVTDEQPTSRRAARAAAKGAPAAPDAATEAIAADAETAAAPAKSGGIGAMLRRHPTAWIVVGRGARLRAARHGIRVRGRRVGVRSGRPSPPPARGHHRGPAPGVHARGHRDAGCGPARSPAAASDPALATFYGSFMRCRHR